MKIAAPFPIREERQEKIDEYNIEFDCKRHRFENLLKWISKHQEKRINLRVINGEFTTDDIDTILKNNDDVVFRLTLEQSYLPYIENKYPFFFDWNCYIINSFCSLIDILSLGVTDVYICEDLLYRLKDVRAICDKYDVHIRFILNRIMQI